MADQPRSTSAVPGSKLSPADLQAILDAQSPSTTNAPNLAYEADLAKRRELARQQEEATVAAVKLTPLIGGGTVGEYMTPEAEATVRAGTRARTPYLDPQRARSNDVAAGRTPHVEDFEAIAHLSRPLGGGTRAPAPAVALGRSGGRGGGSSRLSEGEVGAFAPLQIHTYDTEAGLPASQSSAQATAERLWNTAKGADTASQRQLAAAAVGQLEKVEDEEAWTGYWLIPGLPMDLFDTPRRAMNALGFGAAEALPDAEMDNDSYMSELMEVGRMALAPLDYASQAWTGLLNTVSQPVARAVLAASSEDGLARRFSRNAAAFVMEHEPEMRALSEAWSPPAVRLDDAEREVLADRIGDRFLVAATTGEIRERAEAHPSLTVWSNTKAVLDAISPDLSVFLMPGEEGRWQNISGVDVLNAAIDPDEARLLAGDAAARGRRLDAAVLTALSTEGGRTMFGIALDILADPLWLVGPAKLGQVVAVGDEVWNVARPAVVAARELVGLVGGSSDDAMRVVVRAMKGEEEALAVVRQGEQAVGTRVEALRAEAARLATKGAGEQMVADARAAVADARAAMEALTADAAAYKGGGGAQELANLQRQMRAAEEVVSRAARKPAAYVKARQAAIRGQLSVAMEAQANLRAVAQRSAPGWYATERGLLELSLPGGRATYAFGQRARPWVSRTWDAGMGAVGKLVEPINPRAINRRVRELMVANNLSQADAVATLGLGERMAWTAGAFADKQIRWGADIWRMLGSAFGTRFLRPAVMAAEQMSRIWNKDAAAMSQVASHLRGTTGLIDLPPVTRQLWDDYQGALGRFFDALGSRESYLRAMTDAIRRDAHEAHALRIRAAAAWQKAGKPADRVVEVGGVKLRVDPAWLTTEYANQQRFVDAIMEEAAEHLERGSGLLDPASPMYRAELQPILRALEEVVKNTAATPQGEDLAQAWLRVVRSWKGSREQADLAKKALDEALRAKAAIEDEATEADKLIREAKKLEKQVEALAKLDEVLTDDGAARALLAAHREMEQNAGRAKGAAAAPPPKPPEAPPTPTATEAKAAPESPKPAPEAAPEPSKPAAPTAEATAQADVEAASKEAEAAKQAVADISALRQEASEKAKLGTATMKDALVELDRLAKAKAEAAAAVKGKGAGKGAATQAKAADDGVAAAEEARKLHAEAAKRAGDGQAKLRSVEEELARLEAEAVAAREAAARPVNPSVDLEAVERERHLALGNAEAKEKAATKAWEAARDEAARIEGEVAALREKAKAKRAEIRGGSRMSAKKASAAEAEAAAAEARAVELEATLAEAVRRRDEAWRLAGEAEGEVEAAAKGWEEAYKAAKAAAGGDTAELRRAEAEARKVREELATWADSDTDALIKRRDFYAARLDKTPTTDKNWQSLSLEVERIEDRLRHLDANPLGRDDAERLDELKQRLSMLDAREMDLRVRVGSINASRNAQKVDEEAAQAALDAAVRERNRLEAAIEPTAAMIREEEHLIAEIEGIERSAESGRKEAKKAAAPLIASRKKDLKKLQKSIAAAHPKHIEMLEEKLRQANLAIEAKKRLADLRAARAGGGAAAEPGASAKAEEAAEAARKRRAALAEEQQKLDAAVAEAAARVEEAAKGVEQAQAQAQAAARQAQEAEGAKARADAAAAAWKQANDAYREMNSAQKLLNAELARLDADLAGARGAAKKASDAHAAAKLRVKQAQEAAKAEAEAAAAAEAQKAAAAAAEAKRADVADTGGAYAPHTAPDPARNVPFSHAGREAVRAALTERVSMLIPRATAGAGERLRAQRIASTVEALMEALREVTGEASVGGAAERLFDMALAAGKKNVDLRRTSASVAAVSAKGDAEVVAVLKKGLDELRRNAEERWSLMERLLAAQKAGDEAEVGRVLDALVDASVKNARVLALESGATVDEMNAAYKGGAGLLALEERIGMKKARRAVAHWRTYVDGAEGRLGTGQVLADTLRVKQALTEMQLGGEPVVRRDILATRVYNLLRSTGKDVRPEHLAAALRSFVPASLDGKVAEEVLLTVERAVEQFARDANLTGDMLRGEGISRGTAILEGVQKGVQTFKDEVLARVRATQSEAARLEGLRPDRAVRLEEARKKVKDAEAAYEAAKPTVKARPGEMTGPKDNQREVGHNLWTDGVRREAEAWEEAIWNEWKVVSEGYTQEEALTALAGLLREAPMVPARAGEMGQRLGQMPPELTVLSGRMKQLFDQYETWYKAVGFDFMADPIERLRAWGTVGYVPHFRPVAEDIASGDIYRSFKPAGTTRGSGTSAIDGMLSMKMNAKERRAIGGVAAEINAAAADHSVRFDLTGMLNRYLQSGKAISAAEYFVLLLRTKVARRFDPVVDAGAGIVRTADELAREAGYVPLFQRSVEGRDIDLLLTGTAEDWAKAGVTKEEIAEAVRGLRERKAESPFGTWVNSVPLLQQTGHFEQIVLAQRAADFAAGRPLWSPLARVDELRAAGMEGGVLWRELAEEVNGIAGRFGLRHVEHEALEALLTDKGWRMYVPAQTAESMIRLFEDTAPTSMVGRAFKGALDWFNSVYKSWFTIAQTSFTVRNAASNFLSNVLDIGVHGALNLDTNMKAAALYEAANLVLRHGSIQAAQAAAKSEMGLGARLGTLTYFIENGIDLGDGVVRSLDEAVELALEHNVLARGYTPLGDMSAFNASMSASYFSLRESPRAAIEAAVKELPKQAFDYGLAAMSALGGVPLAVVPRKFGATLAQFVETQARCVNFIAGLKGGRSVEQAGRHVQKFLFNYEDLTNFQKTWMRSLIPFFTWTQKNMILQAEMIRETPAFYQKMSQAVQGLAELSEAIDRDAGLTVMPRQIYSDRETRARSEHLRQRIILPLPKALTGIEGIGLTGFGTPQEGAMDLIAQIGELVSLPKIIDGDYRGLRLLAQANFAVRMVTEAATQADVFYGRGWDELNNARDALQTFAALEKIRRMEIPVVSSFAAATHYAMQVALQPTITVQADTTTRANASGWRLWIYRNLPISQTLRKAASGADAYAVAHMSDPRSAQQVWVAPHWLRVLNTFMGIGTMQDNPYTIEYDDDRQDLEAWHDLLQRQGTTRASETSRLR